MHPEFSKLTEDDYRMIAGNWVSVANLVSGEYGAELDESTESLDLLQRVRDDDLVGEEGYVALGVALGRIMAKNIPGLDWAVVNDEFGRDCCIRFRDTTLLVSPVSMVMKRSAPGERLNFRELFDMTRAQVAELGPRVD